MLGLLHTCGYHLSVGFFFLFSFYLLHLSIVRLVGFSCHRRVLTRGFDFISFSLPALRCVLFLLYLCRAVAEGGGVRPLLRLLYLVYVLSFFLVTAYD